jgi:hypothetical protein
MSQLNGVVLMSYNDPCSECNCPIVEKHCSEEDKKRVLEFQNSLSSRDTMRIGSCSCSEWFDSGSDWIFLRDLDEEK